MGAYDELDKFQTEEGRKIVSAFVAKALADEQQPADVVTAEQQQDGAAEELRTFLDALPPRIDIVADWTRNGVRTELTAEALRAVLAERDQLRQLLGIGVDCEQWDAIAEAEGRRYEGEQINDTLVGYLAYQRESSRALSGFLQGEVKELEAERTALAARVAELESEREVGVRAVESMLRAMTGTERYAAAQELHHCFADRIEALNARAESATVPTYRGVACWPPIAAPDGLSEPVERSETSGGAFQGNTSSITPQGLSEEEASE